MRKIIKNHSMSFEKILIIHTLLILTLGDLTDKYPDIVSSIINKLKELKLNHVIELRYSVEVLDYSIEKCFDRYKNTENCMIL